MATPPSVRLQQQQQDIVSDEDTSPPLGVPQGQEQGRPGGRLGGNAVSQRGRDEADMMADEFRRGGIQEDDEGDEGLQENPAPLTMGNI